MFRFVTFMLFFISFCFSSVLSSDEAFKLEIQPTLSEFEAKINFDKSVYLYADKLKFVIKNQNLNEFLEFKEPKKDGANQIYDENFIVFLPLNLLKKYDNNEVELEIFFQGCSHSGFCYAPLKSSFKLNLNSLNVENLKQNETITNSQSSSNDEIIANTFKNSSAFWVLLSFFGYGLLLSLTPCVLPMVPILSAIIVAKKNVKNAKKSSFFASLLYVISMSVANAIFGIIAASFGASLQGYLQTPLVLISSSAIFVILAFFTFGFGARLEIFSKFQNALNSKAGEFSGNFGVIFMGFLSALVISPCVAAPLAGALLYIASSGDVLLGGLALFVLSIGMGVPLLGLGAGFSFLPKPGAWMNKITIIFGFIMLGMAVWLLSRILSEQICYLLYGFLGICAVCFLADFGVLKSLKDRIFAIFLLILLAFSFCFIMLFVFESFGAKQQLNSSLSSDLSTSDTRKKISSLNELNEFVKNAKSPVMIDFWANWCVNCKEFEEEIKNDILAQNLLLAFEVAIVDLSSMNDKNQEILSYYGLFGPPAFLFFENGELKHKIVATPKKDDFVTILKEFIK